MSDQILDAAFDDAVIVIGYIADAGLRDAAMEAVAAEHARRQEAFDSAPVVHRRKPVEVPAGGSLLAELSKRTLTL